MADVKITVVKKLTNKDLIDEYGENVEPVCGLFEVGDEFIVKRRQMPEGFCSWAWADIQRDVVNLATGGNVHWINREGVEINCCTDGLHPVIFKLERILMRETIADKISFGIMMLVCSIPSTRNRTFTSVSTGSI